MIEKLTEILNSNSGVITGGFFAFLIAVLTGKGRIMERITGGILCALLSTGLYFGLLSIFPTIPTYSAVAIGSFVGFVGVDECKRILIEKIVLGLKIKNKKSEENDE